MKKSKLFAISIILNIIMLAGCNTPMESELLTEEDVSEPVVIESAVKESDGKPIVIWQSPFNAYEYSSETLIVKIQEKSVWENNAEDEDYIYEILLTDYSGDILQQFSDSIVAEAIQNNEQITLEDINSDWYNDLLIGNLVYIWNPSDNIFYEKAIQMPKGYKVDKSKGVFTVFAEENGKAEESIYRINRKRCEIVKLRTWILDKAAGTLEIRDCLKDKPLLVAQVEMDEDGKLKAEEYYKILFWQDLPYFDTYAPEQTIETVFYGMTSFETLQFENKEDLLKTYGFEGKESFYQYYDRLGNLNLELFFDEKTGAGCGIRYFNRYTEDLEEVVETQGFAFDGCQEAEWEKKNPYYLKTVEDTDGVDDVEDYEEIFEYTKEGKLDYYESRGISDLIREEGELVSLLGFDYAYRDDGTLAYRNYWHNSYIFFTSDCSRTSFYDEQERPVYEYSYITHGSLDHYYIYLDDDSKPEYYLSLDNNMGTVWPVMTKYK